MKLKIFSRRHKSEESSESSNVTLSPNSKPSELLELHPGGDDAASQNMIVDIVAVHGLGGDREGSWTTSDGIMWLDDLLPADAPNARILVYGYDSSVISSSPQSSHSIHQHASQLVENLVRMRKNSPRRPIIFIAHSLGGIIVKHALVQCNQARPDHNDAHKWIKVCTYGVLFFGTPHAGANGAAFAKVIIDISRVFANANSGIVKHLRRNSEHLRQLSRQYTPISGDFRTVFFYEEYPTPVIGRTARMVVPMTSAVIQGQRDAQDVAIHKDHHKMVKFSSKDDTDYRSVRYYITDMIELAPKRIESNIKRETEMRAASRL